ncbi:uncharacterized protein LOC129314163 [Prosopis cineraria]|uniref:uncharacterized protein LOC129314163 n=1 Tax=Prosopis cineraria TaxID=364024 RepID=UPI00240F46D8|nr:uncharacterized protein LOC129314163 [Prosopis cineraria]
MTLISSNTSVRGIPSQIQHWESFEVYDPELEDVDPEVPIFSCVRGVLWRSADLEYKMSILQFYAMCFASHSSASMASKLRNNKTWVASVVFCFLMLSFVHMTKAGQGTVTQAKELEIQKLLNKLNKPAVKSLKPAFDHPKLKNHKIRMRPTFLPKGIRSYPESKTIDQTWHQSGSCPEGTIPIRTTKDDIMRASTFQRFGMKDNKSLPNLSKSLYSSTNIHDVLIILEMKPCLAGKHGKKYATIEVVKDKYYGAKATLNVWKTNIQKRNEFSLSQIWVMNQDDDDNVESIEAGWQIQPMLYGDDSPRLFIYWTVDSYECTGCYNLLCSGFVQVSNAVALGGALPLLSVYNGTQYGFSLLIWKMVMVMMTSTTSRIKEVETGGCNMEVKMRDTDQLLCSMTCPRVQQ